MFNFGGACRDRQPEDTLAALEPMLLNKFGMTRVANVTGLDNIGVPVHVAIRPNGKCLAVSQGKGLTHGLAKVSAIMESIENWYAENISPDRIVATGTYEIVQTQYERVFCYPNEKEGFAEHEFEWIACKNLVNEQIVWLPREHFSLDTTEAKHFFPTSSNGLASGNDLDEAICHSLFELIERDSVTKWYMQPEDEQDKRLIDLSSIPFPFIQDLLAKIFDAGLTVYLWEATADLDFPTFYCVIADEQAAPHTVFTGQGCHYFDYTAMSRAITEACQARLTFISGSRDDIFPDFYQNMDAWPLIEQLQQTKAEFVYEAKTAEPIDDMSALKQITLTRLVEQGVEQLFLFDYQAEEAIAVVQIIAPQLLGNDE